MRSKHRYGKRLRSNGRLRDARAAHSSPVGKCLGYVFVILVFLLQGSILFASELESGPILGNPMEKFFDESPVEPSSLKGKSAKRPDFSDQSLPRPTTKDSAKIRQVSSAGEPKSIWDQPFPAIGNEAGPVDWGVGPALTPPVSAPNSPGTSGAPAASSPYGWGTHFGVGPSQSHPSTMPYPGTGTNSYFNTGSDINASPATNPNANLPSPFFQQGNVWNGQAGMGNMGAYGFGYYDPNTGQLYPAGPYASPYGSGMSPYGGMPGGMMGQYDPNGGMYGNGMYGNGMYGGGGFNYGASPNEALLRAMMQQEVLRHQTSLAEEEEKEERRRQEELEKAEKEAADRWSLKQLMPVQVSSPLSKTLWNGVKTMSVFNTPEGPDRGVGMPLATRSWLDRPYYGGLFVGSIWGSDLVSGMIKQDCGGDGGLIFGYNMNDYWGLESRLHFSSIDIKETAKGTQAYQSWYVAENEVPAGGFVPPLSTRSNDMTILDLGVHYYPLGNAKFRPFFKYGLGIAHFKFVDTYGNRQSEDTFAMPFGLGLRYWWNERIAFQVEAVDNVIFAKGAAKTQNNWAITVGITYSFGSSKKRKPIPYWPYTPSTGSKW